MDNFKIELKNIQNRKLNELKNKGLTIEKIYDLSRALYLVSYNAEILNDKKNNEIIGMHKFKDINKFIDKFVNIVEELNMKKDKESIKELFRIVKKLYIQTATQDEYNQKSGGIIPNEKYYLGGAGHVGTYYNFNEIPEETLNKIESNILDKC